MTIVTVSETPVIISTDATQVVGPTGPSGATSYGTREVVNTVADIATTTFDAATKAVTVLGYSTVGVGSFTIRRVNSQPAHPWRFQSADGGWWEGFERGSIYYADAFGFVADGATDNSAAWTNWSNYCRNNVATGAEPSFTLRFGAGTYYFASPVNVYQQMILEGSSGGVSAAYGQMTVLLFPVYTTGIILNRHNTDGVNVLPAFTNPGADGTILRQLRIEAKVANGQNYCFYPFAFGVWAKCRFAMHNCVVTNWSHSCVAIIASAGIGNWAEGNADGFVISNSRLVNCAGNNLWISGSDCNAGATYSLDLGSAAFGIRDDSQLGNNHFAPQAADIGTGFWQIWGGRQWKVCYNGNAYNIIQSSSIANGTQMANAQITPPSGTTADNAVWHYLGAETPTIANGLGIWGQVQDSDNLVYTVVPGQEANMWVSTPHLTPAVWGTGVAATPGRFYTWWPVASQMATKTGVYAQYASLNMDLPGPYCMSGAYRLFVAAGFGVLHGGYVEGISEYGGNFCTAFGRNVFIGGNVNEHIAPWSAQVFIGATLSNLQATQDLQITKVDGAWIDVGDPSQNLGGILGFTDNTHWPLGLKLRQDTGALDYINCDYNNGNTATYFRLSGPSASTPYAFLPENMYVGEGANKRRLTFNNASPVSGSHQLGEIWFNSSASLVNGAFGIGWYCSAAGTPGTWQTIFASSVHIFAPCTVAQLGSAASWTGWRGMVTDSTVAASTNFGAIVAGGAGNVVPVYSDGTNWRIG